MNAKNVSFCKKNRHFLAFLKLRLKKTTKRDNRTTLFETNLNLLYFKYCDSEKNPLGTISLCYIKITNCNW